MAFSDSVIDRILANNASGPDPVEGYSINPNVFAICFQEYAAGRMSQAQFLGVLQIENTGDGWDDLLWLAHPTTGKYSISPDKTRFVQHLTSIFTMMENEVHLTNQGGTSAGYRTKAEIVAHINSIDP